MKVLELIVDLLKGYAWQLFFGFLIVSFRLEIRSFGEFLASLIRERGARLKHGDTEFAIDPPGTKKSDVIAAPTTEPNLVSGHAHLTLPAFSVTAEGGKKKEVEFGFLRMANLNVEVSDFAEVLCDPDVRLIGGKEYLVGQKVFFAVRNATEKDLIVPECFIEFPSVFRHLHTEEPQSGTLVVNSDLWGSAGQLTELRDVTLSTTELSSVLARVLKPTEFRRFFVRFNLPEQGGEFTLSMKVRLAGTEIVAKILKLNVAGKS